MVITATLLAIFLSPRNVTFTCNEVLITNWTNITRQAGRDDKEDEPAAHMTLQVIIIVCNIRFSLVNIRSMEWLRIIITFQLK